MLKMRLLLLVLVFWPSYSSSESIAPYYGYTNNAAANALRWSMGSILPSPPGLEIQNVLYSYTLIKDDGEAVTVYVQNENANGTGYIFRDREDWSPTSPSGLTVDKVIPVGSIHRDLWGDGSIEVVGNGEVVDPNVVYTYRVDPCYNPQYDPNCPGYEVPYVEPPKVDYEIYNAVDEGDSSQAQYNPDEELYEDEEEKSEEELREDEEAEEQDRNDRLDKALFEAGRAELFALALQRSQLKDAISLAVNLNPYYEAAIDGGVYNDSMILVDRQMPDAKDGLRNNFAQQLLHQQMVDMQYNKSTGN